MSHAPPLLGSTKRKPRRRKTAERGYDGTWRKFRKWFLDEHPLCHDCEVRGLLTKANEVHHIHKVATYPHLRLVESNCMALCGTCHSRRTLKGE